MDLHELAVIKDLLDSELKGVLPDHSLRVSIDYPDSTNPVCFFEADGRIFAQGSFWANNEYRIEAMNTVNGDEIMNESGTLATLSNASTIIQRFCEKVRPR